MISKKEKKQRKLLSIDKMNELKVKEWERNKVFDEISSYDWIELKMK